MTLKPVPIHEDAESTTSSTVQKLGRIAGPAAALLMYVVLSISAGDMNVEARATASIGALMAVWWMTEALPLAVTSLLPLVLFPLTGVLTVEEAAAPYAEKNIYLFFGGFLIALAVERWNLHRRIALLTVLRVGTRPDRLIGGIMLATGGVSMWISNTATAAMMLPIGMSLVTLLGEHLERATAAESGRVSAERATRAFATCIMLGIAYSASIGGLGTPVGTPTNIALTGFASKRGIAIGFGSWMAMAIPLVVVLFGATWVLLTRWLFPIRVNDLPGGRELIVAELKKLGPLSRGEKVALGVFLATASAWVLREPVKSGMTWLAQPEHVAGWPDRLVEAIRYGQRFTQRLDDAVIAMVGAIALFLIPIDRRRGVFALDWATAAKVPWGILLLFGGGFSLTAGMTKSGLTPWIGQQLSSLQGMPTLVIVLASVTVVIFTTELTSNTPTILAFLPILYSVAQGLDIDPLMLMVPATLAASCAFMLPVGTPPNAIVFATGRVTIGQMVRAGWCLNLIGIALITVAMYTLGCWALGVK